MIATSDMVDVFADSEQLGKFIMQSEIAYNYRVCKQQLKKDIVAREIIQNFVKMKDKYEEVQRFGKYHPDYKNISTQIRELKRELDLNDTIAAFKQAEEALESLLNEISAIIAGEVSTSIKVPTGNPFFDNRSCQGGCATGGPCGCG